MAHTVCAANAIYGTVYRLLARLTMIQHRLPSYTYTLTM